MPTTYVLGLGNILMGDDGFGPAVVRAFAERYAVGPDVSIVDLGTPGLDLTPCLADAEHVVIVDTVKSELEPGTLRLFQQSDILRRAPAARVGPHDPGVKEALLLLEFAGREPQDVVLVGIVPNSVSLSLDLSPAVSRMVPAAADLVAAVLQGFGIAVTAHEAANPAAAAPPAAAKPSPS